MTTYQFPLVGNHFRGVPAKQVLGHLAACASLGLRPDDENLYDGAAIRVVVNVDQILASRWDALDNDLANTGWTADKVRGINDADGPGNLFIGFVGASGGKPCNVMGLPGNQELRALREANGWEWEEIPATLGFSADGKPLVEVNALQPAHD